MISLFHFNKSSDDTNTTPVDENDENEIRRLATEYPFNCSTRGIC